MPLIHLFLECPLEETIPRHPQSAAETPARQVAMRLCPGCNLPARPAFVWAAQDGGSAAVVGLCARCASQVGPTPSPRQKKRLSGLLSKAMERQDRFWAEHFEDIDQAVMVTGLVGAPSMSKEAMDLLGWPT